MKSHQFIQAALCAWMLGGSPLAWAQDKVPVKPPVAVGKTESGTGTTAGITTGTIGTASSSLELPGTGSGGNLPATGSTDAPKLDLPEIKLPPNIVLPDSVKAMAKDFQAQSQVYRDHQKEIGKLYKGATAAEREQLKAQMAADRALFLEQTKEIRADLKEQIKDLKKIIKNPRPIDAGVGEGGGRPRRGGGP